MKYLISFLLLALVAVTASPSYEVYESTYDVIDYEELENYISWKEIWNKIKSFVQQVKDALKALTGNMKNIIDKIKQTIKKIIGVGSANDIRDKIVAVLKKMFEEGEIQTIENDAKGIEKDITKLLVDVLKDGTKCILWPPTASKCFTNLFNKLKTTSADLMNKAKEIVNIAENINTYAVNCASQIRKNTTEEIKIIYNDIAICVAA